MNPHTTDDILRAAAAWVWLPRGGEQSDEHLRLVRYPERFGGGVRGSQVRSTDDAATVLDRAVEHTREWGEDRLTFWTSASDAPDLEDELRHRGAAHVDTVTVFARPLEGVSIDAAEGATAELVTTIRQLREVDTVNVPVWEQTPLDEEGLQAELHEVIQGVESGQHLRVLSRIDGRAVSTGGCTLVDGFTRLWGAATLEQARGRGAYRAVLAERLRLSAQLGAMTALVKGRVATSAPILTRVGFRPYGEERAYRLRVGQAVP